MKWDRERAVFPNPETQGAAFPGPERSARRRSRLVLAAMGAVAFSCGAAVTVAAWDGHGTAELSASQAAAIAADPSTPPEQRKLAAIALRRAGLVSIRALVELAAHDDAAGVDARNSISLLSKELQKR
jgi:hypothetical protein